MSACSKRIAHKLSMRSRYHSSTTRRPSGVTSGNGRLLLSTLSQWRSLRSNRPEHSETTFPKASALVQAVLPNPSSQNRRSRLHPGPRKRNQPTCEDYDRS